MLYSKWKQPHSLTGGGATSALKVALCKHTPSKSISGHGALGVSTRNAVTLTADGTAPLPEFSDPE
jgi:hypothetical protein